ncbi:MAG: thiol-disulfide oxidoreductase DCC family protein [Beijerinckiaceae bacterium]
MSSEHGSPPDAAAEACTLTVYYDGSCPLCRGEIALYQRADGSDVIDFRDVSQMDAVPGDLTPAAAMARFHVRNANGKLVDGARGFIQLWLTLPRWRWLGRIAGIPPLPWLLEGLYRAFLPVRPLLQHWARRLG